LIWLVWLAVTVLGLAWAGWFGHFPFGFPPISGAAVFGRLQLSSAMLGSLLVGSVFGAVGAAAVALAQWLVLRRAIGVSVLWIPATMSGIALMHALGDPIGDTGQVPAIQCRSCRSA
jgi:hypothetical protein